MDRVDSEERRIGKPILLEEEEVRTSWYEARPDGLKHRFLALIHEHVLG